MSNRFILILIIFIMVFLASRKKEKYIPNIQIKNQIKNNIRVTNTPDFVRVRLV